MGKTPFISVVTPTYNRADCIERCVKSVAFQDVDNYEHIIVDDGSTDGTSNILAQFVPTVDRTVAVRLQTNSGVNHARNVGISKARGDFVLFLDSDDWLVEGALANITGVIANRPGFLHYLFVPEDRQREFESHSLFRSRQIVVTYEQWVTGAAIGDFVHVVAKESLEGMPFFENVRGMEDLNWFRILKREQRQLFSNIICVKRERGRADTQGLNNRLSTLEGLRSAYEHNASFIQMYFDDFMTLNRKKLGRMFIKTFLIGLALGEYLRNAQLITRMSSVRYWPAYLCRLFNRASCSNMSRTLLKSGSVLKNKVRETMAK